MTLNYSYRVGGSLAWNDPSYVTRAADENLYNAIAQGHFSQVLGPRQIGKSSLRVRTAHRLQQEGTRCASVQATDLGLSAGQERATQGASNSSAQGTSISNTQGTSDSNAQNSAQNNAQNNAQWVTRLISLIWDSLYPAEYQALSQWLEETHQLTPTVRLELFTQSILLKGTAGLKASQNLDTFPAKAATFETVPCETLPPKTVIFIDEIDYLLAFPKVADIFFKWIAQCYQCQRLSGLAPRLAFVILGTAIAAEVDSYLYTTEASQDHGPQEASLLQRRHAVSLENFKLSETQALHQGFRGIVEEPLDVLKAIFCWTNGQPFLTQKLCGLVFNFLSDLGDAHTQKLRLSNKALGRWVSHMVDSEIVDHWRQKDDPAHLRAMSDRISQSPNCTELVALYQRVAIGTPIITNGSRLQAELLMSGLVIVCDQQLQFNNEIYRHIFDPLLANNPCSAPSTRYTENNYAALSLCASNR